MTAPHDPLADLRAIWAAECRLTRSARAVLTVLVLHRNNSTGRCDPSVTRIAAETQLARSRALLILSVCEELGIVTRHRNPGLRTSYTLTTSPLTGLVLSQDRSCHRTGVVLSQDGTRPLTGPKLLRNSESTTKIESAPRGARIRPGQYDRSPDFAEWWGRYPNKKNKLAAHRAWLKLTSDQRSAAADALERHLEHWRATNPTGEYVPHGGAWLNGARWEDVLSAPSTTAPRRSEYKG